MNAEHLDQAFDHRGCGLLVTRCSVNRADYGLNRLRHPGGRAAGRQVGLEKAQGRSSTPLAQPLPLGTRMAPVSARGHV
jgi:hypothetical protein